MFENSSLTKDLDLYPCNWNICMASPSFPYISAPLFGSTLLSKIHPGVVNQKCESFLSVTMWPQVSSISGFKDSFQVYVILSSRLMVCLCLHFSFALLNINMLFQRSLWYVHFNHRLSFKISFSNYDESNSNLFWFLVIISSDLNYNSINKKYFCIISDDNLKSYVLRKMVSNWSTFSIFCWYGLIEIIKHSQFKYNSSLQEAWYVSLTLFLPLLRPGWLRKTNWINVRTRKSL